MPPLAAPGAGSTSGIVDDRTDLAAEFVPRDHPVHESAVPQELRPLEAGGQLLSDRLLDDPGPAKPISACRSARITSPSIAKLAVTPPVVGSASTLMYRPPASWNRARAAEVLAICISENPLSIIRAPPEAVTITSGSSASSAFSIARAIFSPITEPIEPPRNVKSITASTSRRPLMKARPLSTPSALPVLRRADSSRWG